jgi:hypothetical protein
MLYFTPSIFQSHVGALETPNSMLWPVSVLVPLIMALTGLRHIGRREAPGA